jgi:hypothetical protein
MEERAGERRSQGAAPTLKNSDRYTTDFLGEIKEKKPTLWRKREWVVWFSQ